MEEKNTHSKQQFTVGLDFGTTKICALIASKQEDNPNLNILGIGIAESDGINRGVVANIDKTVRAIKKAVEQAEQQAGVKIEDVVVGIAGDHVESFQTRGIIGISNENNEISEDDVKRLLKETRNLNIPKDRRIIHVIPQEFIVDDQDGIYDPVGMSGVRLEAIVHIVTGLETAVQNIYRCVERAGLKVHDVILEPLASSNACLTPEEKEVGVALIDIGGGTTDIAIFEEDIIRYTSVFAIAGKQVTDDIRKGLGIVATEAERVKREYGYAYRKAINKDEVFMIAGIGGRKPNEIAKTDLCDKIQPRMEEILSFAYAEIKNSGYLERLGAGVVITGGTTLLRGSDLLTADLYDLPVKIGIPNMLSYSGLVPEIENPVYSTVVGLALHGLKKGNMSVNTIVTDNDEKIESDSKKKEVAQKDNKPIFKRITNFLKEL
jgi:cell division protein FtsA